MKRGRSPGIGGDLVKGAIAGAVATFVMGKVTTVMYQREDRSARRREDEARSGKTAYGVAAVPTSTLQLLDSSGRLTLLDKANLREISILQESPMPSYEGKLSAQELADVVAYLRSLKGRP